MLLVMDITRAAAAMDALGAPVRLSIYRMLVSAGEQGMNIGRIQHKTGFPALSWFIMSTLLSMVG